MPQRYETSYDRQLVAKARRAAKSGLEVLSAKGSTGYFECYIADGTGKLKLLGVTTDRRVHNLICRLSIGRLKATLQPLNS